MLLLTEEKEGLWERFQRGDPGAEATPILPRWHRSLRLGVRPDGAAHPIAVRGHELVTRRDAALGMLADANGVIDAIEQEVSARGLLAVVADASGVIVRAHGGDAFTRDVKKSRLIEGVRWDEAARGTNAIGTALAERQPIAVVGRGHWESVNHGLFCYAAPVIDPLGQLVAVVDVTGPLPLDSSALGAAVRSATAAMEQILRAKAYAKSNGGSRRLVERMVDRAATPAVIVEASGVVTARNAHAVAELDLPPGPIPVERLFGVGWPELARAAATGPTTFETRRRAFAVDFEPVFVDEQLLALVCFFEGAGRRAAVAGPKPSKPLPSAFDRIFAEDPQAVAAKQLAARLAPSELPFLLLAETGTGKELFAQAIHRASPRAAHPLVAVNCGALSGALLESELFGYAPGAFTGARPQGAEGKIAAAHRGTLFLDEVAEMSPAAQAMLLRFLEDGLFTRVGESTPRRSDIRLVCATCRDLPKLVAEGAFRQDLFFRIQGGCVKLPPLRERTDRVAMARMLASQPLGASAEAWILDHSWPGNIRELKTALAHASALSDGEPLERSHFPRPLLDLPPPNTGRRATMHAMAEQAVARAGGNLSEAARALGVARSTLYRMLGR